MYLSCYNSPLGKIFLASDGQNLTELCFKTHKYRSTFFNCAVSEPNLPVFKQTVKWLDIYFSGKVPGFTPPINPQGKPFSKTVWDILLKIPYGNTATYGQIAGEIAKQKGLNKMSAQAVGRAAGNNPIAIIIPCHRVIGSDGSLTGYSAGLDKKIKLLKSEKIFF